MNVVYQNVAAGKFCAANIAIVTAGWIGVLTLDQVAKIAVAFFTCVWLITQTVLAIRSAMRKRRKD